MTVDKASTCCGKSAECLCGMYPLLMIPLSQVLTHPQPSKPSARAESSLLSTAHATRPPPRTLSPALAARAALVPLATATATVLRLKTSSLPASLVLADRVLRVS